MSTSTIVTTSTGGIAIAYDYSAYFERVATALEKIATDLETIVSASTSTGVRTVGAYDWTRPTEVYSWYNQNLSPIAANSATVNTLVNEISTITNSLPKFL